MNIKVKHFKAGGSSLQSSTCLCSSWLEHWEKNIPPERNNLVCRFCEQKFTKDDLVLSYVVKVDSTDKSYYITKMCCECADKEVEFYVNEADLVSSDPNKCMNK